MTRILLGLALGLTSALPAKACDPLEPAAFGIRLDGARRALLEDDSRAHRATVDALLQDLPCATFELGPHELARLLLHRTLATDQQGNDDTGPLATALRIEPELDRLVGVGHPLARWTPPPLPADAPVYHPTGDAVRVDGTRQTQDFALDPSAAHLVQFWHHQTLHTRWIEPGEGLEPRSPAWRAGPSRVAPRGTRIRLHLAGGALVGLGAASGLLAGREHHLLRQGPVHAREQHEVRRNTATAVAATSTLAGLAVVGVGWSISWRE